MGYSHCRAETRGPGQALQPGLSVGKAGPSRIPQLCGGSQEVGGLPPIWALLRPRSRGLGAKPVVALAKPELVPEPRAGGGRWGRQAGSGPRDRPPGPALALLSWSAVLSRSQGEGHTERGSGVTAGRQARARDRGGPLGQHGLLHGLLQRLPRHQQAHHLLRALGEPLPGLVVRDHGHVPAIHLARGENTAYLSSLPSAIWKQDGLWGRGSPKQAPRLMCPGWGCEAPQVRHTEGRVRPLWEQRQHALLAVSGSLPAASGGKGSP